MSQKQSDVDTSQIDAVNMINARINELKIEIDRLTGKYKYYSDKDLRNKIDHIKKTLASNYDMLQLLLTTDFMQ